MSVSQREINPLKIMFIASCGYYLHFCADSPHSNVFLPLIGWISSPRASPGCSCCLGESVKSKKKKKNVIRLDGKNHADLRSVTPTMKTHHTERTLKPLKSHLRKIKELLKKKFARSSEPGWGQSFSSPIWIKVWRKDPEGVSTAVLQDQLS